MTNNKIAIFGGGCFWCTEAIYQNLKGVQSVMSGYAGGQVDNPTYKKVCTGQTGHAEVIKIEFDPAIISYQDLLEVFFATHDPTTLNRQGNDQGTQYRSIILYADSQQQQLAQAYLKKIQPQYNQPIVTQLEALNKFWPAEDYHQNYYNANQNKPYCQLIISPKLTKFKETHPQLIK